MRSIQAIVFATLGAFSGCQSCDCFGTREPGDTVPSVTPPPGVAPSVLPPGQ